MRWVVLLFAITLEGLVARSASAADVEGLLHQGVELRRAGKDAEALECFKRAYEIAPSARARAQQGLAEQALGRWVDAESHLTAALTARDDQWIAKFRAVLESSRATVATHLGSIDIVGSPIGASIAIDGHIVGALPLAHPLRVPAGIVLVEVTAPGYEGARRRIDVNAGGSEHETIELAAVRPSPGVPMQSEPSTRASVAIEIPPTAQHPTPSIGRRAAWVSLWSAGGLAVVGGVALGVRELEARSFRSHGCGSKPMDSACSDRESIGNAAKVGGIVSLGSAGIVGVTAGVLFATSSPGGKAGTEVSLSCAPDIEGRGASCLMLF